MDLGKISASSFLYRLTGCLDLDLNAGQHTHMLPHAGKILLEMKPISWKWSKQRKRTMKQHYNLAPKCPKQEPVSPQMDYTIPRNAPKIPRNQKEVYKEKNDQHRRNKNKLKRPNLFPQLNSRQNRQVLHTHPETASKNNLFSANT